MLFRITSLIVIVKNICQHNMENAILSEPVPNVLHEVPVQPVISSDLIQRIISSDISNDLPSFGKIHYKLDYDFGSNKVRSLLCCICRLLPDCLHHCTTTLIFVKKLRKSFVSLISRRQRCKVTYLPL